MIIVFSCSFINSWPDQQGPLNRKELDIDDQNAVHTRCKQRWYSTRKQTPTPSPEQYLVNRGRRARQMRVRHWNARSALGLRFGPGECVPESECVRITVYSKTQWKRATYLANARDRAFLQLTFWLPMKDSTVTAIARSMSWAEQYSDKRILQKASAIRIIASR